MVPQDCKDGINGNRNLYHFCLAILIFMDITVPLALLAVIARSSLTTTLALYPPQEVVVKQPAEVIVVPEKPAATKVEEIITLTPAAESLVYVGQA